MTGHAWKSRCDHDDDGLAAAAHNRPSFFVITQQVTWLCSSPQLASSCTNSSPKGLHAFWLRVEALAWGLALMATLTLACTLINANAFPQISLASTNDPSFSIAPSHDQFFSGTSESEEVRRQMQGQSNLRPGSSIVLVDFTTIVLLGRRHVDLVHLGANCRSRVLTSYRHALLTGIVIIIIVIS